MGFVKCVALVLHKIEILTYRLIVNGVMLRRISF